MTDTVTVPDPPATPGHRGGSAASFVVATIARIQSGYLRTPADPRSRAALAQLRRGVGREVGSVPEILELTTDPDARGGGEGPTRDERAIHGALTLYALHQQSQRRGMFVAGVSFGTALGRIKQRAGTPVPGVIRRFQALGTSSDLTEALVHARALVTLLRSADQGFDYGWFTRDLIRLQDPARADAVRLSWGRDFYRVRAEPTDAATDPTASTTSEEP
ncbi:type I-E CRISPR-associated protein Cse2/CasB [Cellulomonas hominis]|uniref:CRISPR system Cascade subunit CasB n=1 Tax=Cellulomonas hominis TaxID=156981 RepID=A0A511FBL9_9CELL|nr:type I-E CRISPR-associated protein Cse2/CasB [Cellulomonas hominis]MBB5472586.1 CRISPR system Cascade subunit CasB [Cellulomonas hominis]MBU5421859.1 type I-E CRISPR-associated protein Cse2/CasB [Cellulomonas hominis]NKY05651.1 type I-E CRISPR-associated protein Cse2/CasB [Cellulomonas hominis]GEL46659.1 hypothetical protein CHO01_17750 [Cellulomonas hominis]